MAPPSPQGLELRCTSTRLEAALISAGTIIGSVLYGGLVTLGLISFNHLSSRKQGRRSLYQMILRGYTVVLILANTIDGIINYLWENDVTIFAESPNLITIDAILRTTLFAFVIFIGVMTDGVLVWRCFMVQRSLVIVPSRIQNIFWVFPLLLWATTLTAGIAATVHYTYDLFRPGTTELLFLTIALVSNVALNFFATSYIIIRLLQHRCIMISSYGITAEEAHLHTVGIILQSAAINIPITSVAIVGMASGNCLATIAMQMVVPCQSLASVLIIYQVSRGKVAEKGEKSRPEEAGGLRV